MKKFRMLKDQLVQEKKHSLVSQMYFDGCSESQISNSLERKFQRIITKAESCKSQLKVQGNEECCDEQIMAEQHKGCVVSREQQIIRNIMWNLEHLELHSQCLYPVKLIKSIVQTMSPQNKQDFIKADYSGEKTSAGSEDKTRTFTSISEFEDLEKEEEVQMLQQNPIQRIIRNKRNVRRASQLLSGGEYEKGEKNIIHKIKIGKEYFEYDAPSERIMTQLSVSEIDEEGPQKRETSSSNQDQQNSLCGQGCPPIFPQSIDSSDASEYKEELPQSEESSIEFKKIKYILESSERKKRMGRLRDKKEQLKQIVGKLNQKYRRNIRLPLLQQGFSNS